VNGLTLTPGGGSIPPGQACGQRWAAVAWTLLIRPFTRATRLVVALPPVGTPVWSMPIEAVWPSGWSNHPRHPLWLLVDAGPVVGSLPVGGGSLGGRILRLHGQQVVLRSRGPGGVALSERIPQAHQDRTAGGMAQPGHMRNDCAP